MSLLHISNDDGVVTATIDAPPVNVMVRELFAELAEFAQTVERDDSARAVVLASANPEFFIAHFDVSAILRFGSEGEPVRPTEVKGFMLMCERFRTMPKPTIAKLGGRVGGGGSELAASCDMRFGVLGRTVVNQMEVPIGILPGGTGTQRLPRLMGRGRAMEVILGGIDLDAATAERWGYLNRAFATIEEMDAYADGLARRIAGYPVEAVRQAKAATLAAEAPWQEGLFEEAYRFDVARRTPEATAAMERFLQIGGQTRDGELRVGELNDELSRPPT